MSSVLQRSIASTHPVTEAGTVAAVLPDADIAQVAEGHGKPAKGGTRVDTLKGGDYVRVWINRGGNHYLIHLPV